MNSLYIANEGRRVANGSKRPSIKSSRSINTRALSASDSQSHQDTLDTMLSITNTDTKYLIECFEIPEKVFYKTRTAKKQIFKYSNIRPVAMKMK